MSLLRYLYLIYFANTCNSKWNITFISEILGITISIFNKNLGMIRLQVDVARTNISKEVPDKAKLCNAVL